MKAYTVAMVRERLAEALDDALAGRPVFIERRGVVYRISVEPAPRRARAGKRAAAIEVLDAAIERGSWTWEWKPGAAGVRLKTRRRA
jgi:hypothetical protein